MMYKPKHKNYSYAIVKDVNASFKDMCSICDNVRNMNVTEAVNLLELFSEGKKPVLYKRHNTKIGHRRELGGKKGRWPMKESKIILKLVKSALANAEQKGLIEEDLVVTHIAANKEHMYARMAPRGRWRRAFYETAFAEVVLEEVFPEDSESQKPKDLKKIKSKKEDKPKEKKPEVKEKPREEVKEKPEPKKAEEKPKEKKPEVKEKPKEEVKEKPEPKKAED